MKQEEQLKLITEINTKGIDLLKSKGADYAGTDDVLKNFKQMNELVNLLGVDTTKIEGTHIYMMLLKIQRLCNLIFSGKTPNHEGIEDTLIDLRNYTDLLNCTLQEKKPITEVFKLLEKLGDKNN